jgi:hypothetical protein
MKKAIRQNCVFIQPAFPAYRTQLTGKQKCVSFEKYLNSDLETKCTFCISLVDIFPGFLPLKDMGMGWGLGIHANGTRIRSPHIPTGSSRYIP